MGGCGGFPPAFGFWKTIPKQSPQTSIFPFCPLPVPKRPAEMLDGADVAMVSADGPAPLAPVEDRDGASRTWRIATGLGASREAGDGPEEVQLAGHRWSWFAGGPRGWRGEFEPLESRLII